MRVDAYLVEAGLARSRGHARELLQAGSVTIDGAGVHKPSAPVPAGAAVAVAEQEQWVGRAAHKLLGAFDAFGTDLVARVSGARCLDMGASTGGFTQVLLAFGAEHVEAVDVGHGQLAAPVAGDPRVTDRSGLNVRHLRPGDLGEPFDLVVGDLSFISLRLVVGVVAQQLAPTGRAVMLVKPQFEVGRERLGKGGIVRVRADREEALRLVLREARQHGLEPLAAAVCPVRGGQGNVEYLVLWRHRDAPAVPGPVDASAPHLEDGDVDARIDAMIATLDEGTP